MSVQYNVTSAFLLFTILLVGCGTTSSIAESQNSVKKGTPLQQATQVDKGNFLELTGRYYGRAKCDGGITQAIVEINDDSSEKHSAKMTVNRATRRYNYKYIDVESYDAIFSITSNTGLADKNTYIFNVESDSSHLGDHLEIAYDNQLEKALKLEMRPGCGYMVLVEFKPLFTGDGVYTRAFMSSDFCSGIATGFFGEKKKFTRAEQKLRNISPDIHKIQRGTREYPGSLYFMATGSGSQSFLGENWTDGLTAGEVLKTVSEFARQLGICRFVKPFDEDTRELSRIWKLDYLLYRNNKRNEVLANVDFSFPDGPHIHSGYLQLLQWHANDTLKEVVVPDEWLEAMNDPALLARLFRVNSEWMVYTNPVDLFNALKPYANLIKEGLENDLCEENCDF